MADNGKSQNEEDSKEQFGVILGYWDQEKTPTIIKDLEQSVDSVETKCRKLLQDLFYYKKYLEESQNFLFNFSDLKKKKHSEKSPGYSGSDPNIEFRKNLLQSEEFKEIFEEKFKEKLLSINEEISNATEKIGLRDNIILFPNEDYLQTFSIQPIEDEMERCWIHLREEFIRQNFFQGKVKSDSKISTNDEFSQITINELKLYQQLSRLSLKKNKGKAVKRIQISSAVGKKMALKLGLRTRRSLKSRAKEEVKGCRVPVLKKNKIKKRNSNPVKNKKNKITVPIRNKKLKSGQSHSPQFEDSASSILSEKKLNINDSEIETICESLTEAVRKRNSQQMSNKNTWSEKQSDSPYTSSFSKKITPFTAGTSTSRSYNIGLNIQQHLSLANYKNLSGTKSRPAYKKISRDGKTSELKRLSENETASVGSLNHRYLTSWNPIEAKNDDSFEVSQVEHNRKVWISERRTSSDFRKVRSKYTGTSPESFLGYHKSTTRQYTNGQKSVIKSESKTAYAVGSKIMVSDCQRTDFFEIDKDEDFYQNASGDGTCNNSCSKLKMEWSKVFGSFVDVYKKYNALKEQVSNNNSPLPDEELKSLEKEIDYAVNKYKEFLKFYSKFLHLKHRLKSLKIACETGVLGPVTSFSLNCHRKTNSCRPTYSMTMKKAFREIQTMQEKIRLVHDF